MNKYTEMKIKAETEAREKIYAKLEKPKETLKDKVKGWKQSYDEHKQKQTIKRVEFLKQDNERLKLENQRANILKHNQPQRYNSGFEGSIFGNSNPYNNQPKKAINNTFDSSAFFGTARPKTTTKKHHKKKVRYVYKKVRA